MKKLLTFIAAFIITASATVFANDETTAPIMVKISFETKFGKAINVKWEKVRDAYVASFTNNNDNWQVYFSADGELLASSRYISKSLLPQKISTAVKSQFPGSCVTQVLEVASETEGTSYYVIVVGYKADLVLHARTNGEIDVVSKTKK